MEPPLRAIISGYYGFRNAGDEAMLAGLIAGLRRAAGVVGAQHAAPLQVTVLSGDAAATTALHGVRAIGRFDVRALRQDLQAANLFISGGGNLFQDATSARSCLYYLYVIRQALKAHVPVVILGQGIGPLRRWWVRALVRRCLNRVHGIALRDSESAQELERLGVRRPPVRIAADLSFAMESPDAAAVAQAWRDLGISDPASVLAVAPRTWRVRGAAPTVVQTLAAGISLAVTGMLAQGVRDRPGDRGAPGDVGQAPSPVIRGTAAAAPTQPGAAVPHVVVFPMQRPQDDEACEALARTVGGMFARPDLPPDMLAAMLGSARAVVGMRLHALMFAVMGGAIPVAISYDPKVDAFMADLGLEVAATTADLAAYSSPSQGEGRVRVRPRGAAPSPGPDESGPSSPSKGEVFPEARLASAIVAAWNAGDDARAALRETAAQHRQTLADTFAWAVEMARSARREPQL